VEVASGDKWAKTYTKLWHINCWFGITTISNQKQSFFLLSNMPPHHKAWKLREIKTGGKIVENRCAFRKVCLLEAFVLIKCLFEEFVSANKKNCGEVYQSLFVTLLSTKAPLSYNIFAML
jgi:hypothetical protein